MSPATVPRHYPVGAPVWHDRTSICLLTINFFSSRRQQDQINSDWDWKGAKLGKSMVRWVKEYLSYTGSISINKRFSLFADNLLVTKIRVFQFSWNDHFLDYNFLTSFPSEIGLLTNLNNMFLGEFRSQIRIKAAKEDFLIEEESLIFRILWIKLIS